MSEQAPVLRFFSDCTHTSRSQKSSVPSAYWSCWFQMYETRVIRPSAMVARLAGARQFGVSTPQRAICSRRSPVSGARLSAEAAFSSGCLVADFELTVWLATRDFWSPCAPNWRLFTYDRSSLEWKYNHRHGHSSAHLVDRSSYLSPHYR
jgi:hypothetical protein